jgi:anti-sigma-K factor RskA
MMGERPLDELADDYVLGLLEPAEEHAVTARLATDPELRRAIGRSRDRFLELDLTAAGATVRPELWQEIAGRLETAPAERATPPASTTAPPARAANDNALRRWRGLATGALAACLLLAAALGWTALREVQPQVIAVLVDEAGNALAIVEDFGDTSARVTLLTDFDVPEGRTMQVWTLPSAELGPVSLGLLPEGETTLLSGPELPPPGPDQLYEITVEQAGGSPTGRPTGPILVKGFARLPR